MPDLPTTKTLLLLGAMALSTLGLAWLALAMEAHWRQVRADAPARRGTLRALGTLALAGSLALCLRADHATMAPLVWVMSLAAGALAVAFTLAWRPHWLAPLTVVVPRSIGP